MARRVVVIGAGAAGLTAALRAAEAGASVALLNAHPRIGLKILMSGGTRCNVTHREVTARDYNGGSRPFARRILRAFTPDQTRAWFETLGVGLKLEETGKLFPVTDDAATVLDALMRAVTEAGVQIQAGARVVRLDTRPECSARFNVGIQTVRDSAALSPEVSGLNRASWSLPGVVVDQWLEADAVVLATGGLSFPRTGSDGSGYALATALGHSLVPPIPALTPLSAEDPLCRSCQGVTVDVDLALWVGGRREVVISGSFLVTHFGYSGPAALDLSRHWLRAEGQDRRVTASFLPGMSRETALSEWLAAAGSDSRTTVRKHLGERLPDRLVVESCGEIGIDASSMLSQVDRTRRAALIERLVERSLPILGTLGYEKAEVTAGGVRLEEVDPSTLESRVTPGLFLCGEVLDVEGRLGGFNFQWAWSSGTVAGRAATMKVRH